MIEESKIDDMSYNFFSDVLAQLGHKLNYDAVVNYAGNSFCEKSWEMIKDANPMTAGTKPKSAIGGMLGMFSQATIVTSKRNDGRKYSWDERKDEE